MLSFYLVSSFLCVFNLPARLRRTQTTEHCMVDSSRMILTLTSSFYMGSYLRWPVNNFISSTLGYRMGQIDPARSHMIQSTVYCHISCLLTASTKMKLNCKNVTNMQCIDMFTDWLTWYIMWQYRSTAEQTEKEWTDTWAKV